MKKSREARGVELQALGYQWAALSMILYLTAEIAQMKNEDERRDWLAKARKWNELNIKNAIPDDSSLSPKDSLFAQGRALKAVDFVFDAINVV